MVFGMRYVFVNGRRMPDHGEKTVPVMTPRGQQC